MNTGPKYQQLDVKKYFFDGNELKKNVKSKIGNKDNIQLIESKQLLICICCVGIDWVWKFSNLYCVNNKTIWEMLDSPSQELKQYVDDLKTKYDRLNLEEKKQLIKYAKELSYHTVKETIFIPLSFREYYNGCIKNIQIKKDGKLSEYIKVPIDYQTPYEFQFKGINKYTFKLEFSKSGFSRHEENEQDIIYEYSTQELNESRIVAPSGKVIALKSLDWKIDTILENEGFPANGNGRERGKLILRFEERERREKEEERIRKEQEEKAKKQQGDRLKRQQERIRKEEEEKLKKQQQTQQHQNQSTNYYYPNSSHQQTQQNSRQSETLRQIDFSQQTKTTSSQTQTTAFTQHKEQDKSFWEKFTRLIGLSNEETKKKEEPKVLELKVNLYLGKEIVDGFKTYQKFQLSNGKTLYVNVWKKEDGCDPNDFSNVFPHDNGYLVNVLFDQVLDTHGSFKKWKKTKMLGFEHETLCSEINKNYVVTDKYFIPIMGDHYFIFKIPLILPYPTFGNQNSSNQYFVFYDYSKGPQSKHFIVIHRGSEKK